MKQRRGLEMVLTRQRPAMIALICLLACGLSVAGAASASGASISAQGTGWQWGDPTPQGDALSDVRFIGPRGYAVGEEGTVLRSDDGGNSWTGEQSGTLENLSRVQEIDPNTVVIAGQCTLRESTDAGASFQELLAGQDCPNGVSSFWFFNATTGFLQRSDGTLQFTGDGGQTLEARTPLPLPGKNGQTRRAASTSSHRRQGSGWPTGTQGGRIMRTTDGASSWTQVASSPQPLTDLTFVSPTEAYAVGWRDTLLQSTDEGKTWHAQPLVVPQGTPSDFYGISCSDASNCVIATGEGTIVHTSDAGSTGSLISAARALCRLLHSQPVRAPSPWGLAEKRCCPPMAEQVFQHEPPVTSNRSSSRRPSASARRLSTRTSRDARESPPRATAAPAGRRCDRRRRTRSSTWPSLRAKSATRSMNRGRYSAPPPPGAPGRSPAQTTSRPSRCWRPARTRCCWSGPGEVRRSTDGGESFGAARAIDNRKRRRRGRRGGAGTRLFGGQLAGAAIFATGEDVFRSTDEGVRWTRIRRPLARYPVEGASFVSAGTGYELCGGLLFFTRDSGRHWRQIVSVPTSATGEGAEVAFSSASDGYVVSEYPEEEKGRFPLPNGRRRTDVDSRGDPRRTRDRGGGRGGLRRQPRPFLDHDRWAARQPFAAHAGDLRRSQGEHETAARGWPHGALDRPPATRGRRRAGDDRLASARLVGQ